MIQPFLLPLLALASSLGAVDTGTVEVDAEGLRNARGIVRACLIGNAHVFPNCSKDSSAFRENVSAGRPHFVFTDVPPGTYALTLFHDENANGKLDTLFGIPKEGFAFSRNPMVRFGAPKYENVAMKIGPGLTRLRVRLQYIL